MVDRGASSAVPLDQLVSHNLKRDQMVIDGRILTWLDWLETIPSTVEAIFE